MSFHTPSIAIIAISRDCYSWKCFDTVEANLCCVHGEDFWGLFLRTQWEDASLERPHSQGSPEPSNDVLISKDRNHFAYAGTVWLKLYIHLLPGKLLLSHLTQLKTESTCLDGLY